tara:strand:- start:670 stop:1101 length:432 start_codon:yes stop_codon:yes gene_type:complete
MSLEKVGSCIREARISNNQSVNELAKNVKISEQQLNAIEEGRDDLLPEKVFVKAMVRKISEKLKLDTRDIMAQLNIEKEPINVNKIEEKEVQNETKTKNFITLNFLFNILFSGIIGFVASSYIFNLFINTNQTPETLNLIKKN